MNGYIDIMFQVSIVIEILLLSRIVPNFIQGKSIKIIGIITLIFTGILFVFCGYLLFKQFPVKIDSGSTTVIFYK